MKKLITFTILFISFCIISVSTFAQEVPGGQDSGSGTGTPPDPGTSGGNTPALVFNLGSAGTFTIQSTSPYYSFIKSILTAFHVPVTNGIVSFTSVSCYNSSILALYYTRCINYSTYNTACRNTPPGCH